ncbi:aspartyl protease family protein At5g10770-like [Trifolium pratense]|uniref:aspartyl protease family protein At5g10770-like n=1 Tax=Trifolium pratense TaxID=57577 RepID=UPI001E693319|nr:aspartyl protease family protein At5g10770-like [Trifolium pratense]
MSLFWFLVFFAHLAIASSLVEIEDNGLRHKQSGMHLKLYHVKALNSSPNSTSVLFTDMLAKDAERVRYLHSRLSNNSDTITSSDNKVGVPKPKLVSTPLKPGLLIGSGNYYAKIGLGTPIKYYSLIVDTGSSFSWLQCQPCTIYCHAQVDPIFNPSASKTYKTLPCPSPQCSSLKASTLNEPSCSKVSNACVYKASYGDSSFSLGYLSQDVLALTPSETLPNFVYGCGQDNQGLFGRSAGIIGLANDKLSLLEQLSGKYGNAFSYCLPTSFSTPNPSNKEGFLSIGTSSLTPYSSYKFTPLLKNPKVPSLYFIEFTSINVAGRPIGVAASSYKVPTIIDSGTVITRLPAPVYNALKNAFVAILSKKYEKAPGVAILDTCFKGSVEGISTGAPEIALIFKGGAGLQLKGHNTLLELEKGVTCLAFAGNSEGNSIAIIGNYQQQTYKVAYDVANSKLGFAPGGCQ